MNSLEVTQDMINDIYLKELNNQNNWLLLSNNYNFNADQLYEFKDKLIWNAVLNNNNNVTEELLTKLLDEGFFSKIMQTENSVAFRYSLKKNLGNKISDIKTLIKHKNCFIASELVKSHKLKISEIAQIIKQPEIGMGATAYVGSDEYPYTIIDINKNKTRIKIQRDDAKPAKGYDYNSNQVYDYSRNPNGPIIEVSLRKDAHWKVLNSTTRVTIGTRSKYTNPSF